MWRTRNNGITDGFHTKMEVLQRQAYGFRNFKNDRLRVVVMCWVLLGIRANFWLGGRDSNPDTQIQSLQSYH